MRFFFLFLLAVCAAHAQVISHQGLPEFSNNGNTLKGICTPSMGAEQIEVWKSSIAPGSCTPRHSHEAEEIFLFAKGKGVAVIGDKEHPYEAPCTLILPAGIEHQIFNTGDVPTDHFVILKAKSKIYNAELKEMQLPWRK